jgi:membrane associated rhomboid family serine protease
MKSALLRLLLLLSLCVNIESLRGPQYRKVQRKRLKQWVKKKGVRPAEMVAIGESILLASCCTHKTPTLIITASNILIFLLWQASFLNTMLWKWMRKNFILSQNQSRRKKYAHTWLSSCFSHVSYGHCSATSYLYYHLHCTWKKAWKPRWFVFFYITSCYLSGLFDEFIQPFDYSGNERSYQEGVSSLGASGTIMAVITFSLLEYPNLMISNPIPGLNHKHIGGLKAALAIISADALRITSSYQPIVHGAHIGGALFGILAYMVKHRLLRHARNTWKPFLMIVVVEIILRDLEINTFSKKRKLNEGRHCR